jgi:hypothetical protein
MLISTTEFSYVAAARNSSLGVKTQDDIEGFVKTDIRRTSKGSPCPSETDVLLLRSAEKSESAWDSQFTAGKADLRIVVMSASTAGRTFHQPRRNAITNGDVLQGRSYPISEPE